eukprot:3540228-Amphidinium_carterae.1
MPNDTHSKQSLFLDQSIVLWCEGVMPGQWHFNYYTGLALASFPNLARALYKWMMNNGFAAIVKEFFINEGEPRFQLAGSESEGTSSYAFRLMAPTEAKEEEFTVTVNNKRVKTTVTIQHW